MKYIKYLKTIKYDKVQEAIVRARRSYAPPAVVISFNKDNRCVVRTATKKDRAYFYENDLIEIIDNPFPGQEEEWPNYVGKICYIQEVLGRNRISFYCEEMDNSVMIKTIYARLRVRTQHTDGQRRVRANA